MGKRPRRDSATAAARDLGELIDRANQPGPGRIRVYGVCVLVQTPPPEGGATPCGMKMFLGFIADPDIPPDTSCLASIPIEAFTGLPANNVYLLGTADTWRTSRRRSRLQPGAEAAGPSAPTGEAPSFEGFN